jgi:biopolymer transport protein TolR
VIDLCLVLLIILMVVSPMMDQPPVDIKLPVAKTVDDKENSISLTVDQNGRMALNTEEISSDKLPQLLNLLIREQGEDVRVVIRADKAVQYGTLTDLLKTAKTAGAQRISIGTEPPKDQ